MVNKLRIYLFFFPVFFALISIKPIYSQEILEITPLFEYITAPEDMESLEDRCNYIVKNFWENYNFKNKNAVDQHALNHAFNVYASAFQFASKKEVVQSVDKLIGKISGNPVSLSQFCTAAEESLYGPRANFWSDEIYIKFIQAALKNKKIPQARKKKFEHQLQSLTESEPDKIAPMFAFTDTSGEEKRYFPMSTPTLLIFGDPRDTSWWTQQIKLDTNAQLEEALVKGKLNILYMVTAELPDWKKNVKDYNTRWTVGYSPEAKQHFDVRLNPAVYVVGADGKIAMKNQGLSQSVDYILEAVK